MCDRLAMRWLMLTMAAVLGLPLPALGLDFDAAIGMTQHWPQLVASRRALELREQDDRALPTTSGNPELSLAPGVGFGPGGTGPAIQALVGQSWNLAGLAGARADAAKAERVALAAELRARQLRLKLDAAHAWLQVAQAQRLLAAAQTELTLAQELAAIGQKAAQRGAITAADATEARAFAGEAELRAVFYEGELHDRAADLARLCALPPAPLPDASGPQPAVTLPDAAAWLTLIQRATDLPEAQARQLQATAERARKVEIHAQHASTLMLGGQFQRDAMGDMQALAVVGVRWSLLDKGQRATALAAEQAVRAQGEASQAAHDGAHILAVAWHEVEHSREREAVLRQKILPAAQELVALREQAFARGAATVFEVLRARRDRSEANRRMIEAETQRLWAELNAWLLHAAMQEGGTP